MVDPNDAPPAATLEPGHHELIELIEQALRISDKLDLHLVGAHLNDAMIRAQSAADQGSFRAAR